jgi:hypothetical protein
MMRKQISLLIVAGILGCALLTVTPLRGADAKKDLVKLKLELPKPRFVGTPKNIKSGNLEKPRKGKRPDLLIPKGCTNVAYEKEVTGSDEDPIVGDLEQVTDGDKEGGDGSYVEFAPDKQYIQIDLEDAKQIYAIVIWHFHSQARVYHDVVIQTAADPDFIMDVKTIYNNDHDNSSGLGVGKDKEYIELYEGRLIPVMGVKARYVRFYSNGSTSNEMNHYTEIEIYGK